MMRNSAPLALLAVLAAALGQATWAFVPSGRRIGRGLALRERSDHHRRLVLRASVAPPPQSFKNSKEFEAALGRQPVTKIQSEADFWAAHNASAEPAAPLMIVKFFASWCKACKSIEPRFRKVALDYGESIACYEIEFVANKDLCKMLEIKKLPCIHFYAGEYGKVEDFLCGPSKFPQVHDRLAPYLRCDPRSDEPCILPPLDDSVPEFSEIAYDDSQP